MQVIIQQKASHQPKKKTHHRPKITNHIPKGSHRQKILVIDKNKNAIHRQFSPIYI